MSFKFNNEEQKEISKSIHNLNHWKKLRYLYLILILITFFILIILFIKKVDIRIPLPFVISAPLGIFIIYVVRNWKYGNIKDRILVKLIDHLE